LVSIAYSVLTTIDLDDETLFAAGEVNKMRTNRLLPHEFEPA